MGTVGSGRAPCAFLATLLTISLPRSYPRVIMTACPGLQYLLLAIATMPTHVHFRRDSGGVISELDLRRNLSDLLGIPPSDEFSGNDGHFVLGKTGIAILLTVDGNGNPTEAQVEIPMSTSVSQVSRLFNSFRAMGWKS